MHTQYSVVTLFIIVVQVMKVDECCNCIECFINNCCLT